MTSGLQYLLPLESDELLYIITLTVHIQLANFKISKQTNHMINHFAKMCKMLQNVKQSGRNLVINWNDVAKIGTILAHYLPITF